MSKKYTIKHTMDLSRDERYVWGDCWALLANGVPVWSDDPDRMPAEDATLARELGGLVDLLNQEADKVKELQARVERLELVVGVDVQTLAAGLYYNEVKGDWIE